MHHMIRRFMDGEIGIECPTEEDAIALFKVLDEHGVRWSGSARGGLLVMDEGDFRTRWWDYREKTGYCVLVGSRNKHMSSGSIFDVKNAMPDSTKYMTVKEFLHDFIY